MAETVPSPPGLLRGPSAGGSRGGTLRILRRICSPVETPVHHRQVRLCGTCSGRRLLSLPGDRRDPPENPHLEGERTLGRRDRPTALRRGGGVASSAGGGEGVFGEGGSPKLPRRTRLKIGLTVKGAEVPQRSEGVSIAQMEGQHFTCERSEERRVGKE